jgi:hypothetical protein
VVRPLCLAQGVYAWDDETPQGRAAWSMATQTWPCHPAWTDYGVAAAAGRGTSGVEVSAGLPKSFWMVSPMSVLVR